MKKVYEIATIEIETIKSLDVITASGEIGPIKKPDFSNSGADKIYGSRITL